MIIQTLIKTIKKAVLQVLQCQQVQHWHGIVKPKRNKEMMRLLRFFDKDQQAAEKRPTSS